MDNNKLQITRELWKRINKRIEEILDYRMSPNNDKLEKISKNLNHTKNYFNDNSIEFENDFKEKFRKLYYSGLQSALSLHGDLVGLYNLKDEVEIEIKKITNDFDKKENKQKLYPPIKIQGDFIAGDKIGRDKNVNSSASNWLEKYWWSFLIPITVGVFIYTINEGRLPGLFKTINLSSFEERTVVATSTPNLLDIYKRAFTYDILADRQDFFRKYINSNIYSDGTVGEISSLGDRYILEINISGYSVLCPQEKTEDFDRLYPLLKGESVRFYGIFTYSTYFGYSNNQLVIDQCSIERK
ncbi:MAG: hypothetical protein Q7S75_03710 [bacterium]|nr:hypothetical protein [bacterium]